MDNRSFHFGSKHLGKGKFFIVAIFLLIILSVNPISAHTINHDLEQTYIHSYVLLFVLANLLPFIGLGILAFDTVTNKKGFQLRWVFLVAIFIGIVPGYFLHTDFTTSPLNKISLLFIGLFLIFIKNTKNKYMEGIFFLFGFSLGFEYGQRFLHTEKLLWLYILTLLSGIIIFILLNNHRVIGNRKLQIPLNIFSMFLIVSGLALILLT